jgi:hypothetical protein
MKLHSGEGPINAAPGAFSSRHRVTGIITDIAVLLSHCESTDLVLGSNTCGEKVAEKKIYASALTARPTATSLAEVRQPLLSLLKYNAFKCHEARTTFTVIAP